MSFSLPQELQEIARVGRVGEDPHEDVRVRVGVGVGVVKFQSYGDMNTARKPKRKRQRQRRWSSVASVLLADWYIDDIQNIDNTIRVASEI